MFECRMCYILGFHDNSINNDGNSLTRKECEMEDLVTGSKLLMRALESSMCFNTNGLF